MNRSYINNQNSTDISHLVGSTGSWHNIQWVQWACSHIFECFEHLPRKTLSLVVALVSPTLLEATHSYMASSRGVRKGWILRTEPEPSSNSITCEEMKRQRFLNTELCVCVCVKLLIIFMWSLRGNIFISKAAMGGKRRTGTLKHQMKDVWSAREHKLCASLKPKSYSIGMWVDSGALC